MTKTTILIAGAAALVLTPAAALAADPCGVGSTNFSFDGLTFTHIFTDFFITASGQDGSFADTSNCAFSVTPDISDGYGVYELDYRGDAELNLGQTTALTDNDSGVVIVEAVGVDPTPPPDPIALEATVLAGHAPGEDLQFDLILSLDANGNNNDLGTFMDTIDGELIGFVTQESVDASLGQLADQRAAAMAFVGGNAGLLLGALEPIDRPTGAGPVAAIGSGLIGASGAAAIDSDFTLLGGAALFTLDAAGADLGGALIAGAVRYAPQGGEFRPLAEAGIWAAPGLGMSLTRSYVDLDQEVFATATTTGAMWGAYGRAGVVYEPDASNEIVLAATLAGTWLSVDGYSESTDGNLFAARIDDAADMSGLAKIGATWTTDLGNGLDVTAMAAVGHTFGDGPTVTGEIDWVGDVSATAANHAVLEYGARLGLDVTDSIEAEAFVLGTTALGIGTHAQIGGALTINF